MLFPSEVGMVRSFCSGDGDDEFEPFGLFSAMSASLSWVLPPSGGGEGAGDGSAVDGAWGF